MTAAASSSPRPVFERIRRTATAFLTSKETRRPARLLLLGLALFMLAINGLNVVSSYVGRDFMSAIERRDSGGFTRLAMIYLTVFGLLTASAVFFRFCEERLGILWREWLTRRLVDRYLAGRTYFRLAESGRVSNPDQRIADDARQFTVTTLSFLLMSVNAALTVVAFSGVLWSISPLLFIVAVGYAAAGTFITVRMGRPLVALNFDQSDREADFRSDLIHVREHADLIALMHRERRLRRGLMERIEAFAGNLRRIVAVNRNVSFFTTGYNYLIQIIPALVVAPLFISGRAEFGVITQSAMAFAHLLGAFSLIVNQIQSISSYTAVVARLTSLVDAMEGAESPKEGGIQVVEEEGGGLAFEGLTLRAADGGRVLLDRCTVSVGPGERLLVDGCNDAAKTALLRAVAGIWESGSGRIRRPGLEQIFFVPERPYLMKGTLRETLAGSEPSAEVTEARMLSVLEKMGLLPLTRRLGGLDAVQDWGHQLTLEEQQLLVLARLLVQAPPVAILERVDTALSGQETRRVFALLAASGMTLVAIENEATCGPWFERLLELGSEGAWEVRTVAGERCRDGEEKFPEKASAVPGSAK